MPREDMGDGMPVIERRKADARCVSCGYSVGDGWVVCTKCGTSIERTRSGLDCHRCRRPMASIAGEMVLRKTLLAERDEARAQSEALANLLVEIQTNYGDVPEMWSLDAWFEDVEAALRAYRSSQESPDAT